MPYKRGIAILISVFMVVCSIATPFSVLADEYAVFEIPYESSGAYAYFSYHGMNLMYNSSNYEHTYQCATWTDSSHTSCQVWREMTSGASTQHVVSYSNMGYMNGKYQSITTNAWDGAGYLNPNQEFVLAFASPRGTFVNNPNIQMYRVDSGGVDTTCNITVKSRFNGTDRLYLFIIVSTQGGSYHINLTDFNNVSGSIKPYYFGYKQYMTNDMSQFLFGESNALEVNDTLTHDLISTGTTSSQSVVSQNEAQNLTLTNTVNDLDSLESQFVTDFNTNMNAINTDTSFLLGTNLTSSMNWVRLQFERMTINTVFGSFIQYALLFGLAILVIGRVRR